MLLPFPPCLHNYVSLSSPHPILPLKLRSCTIQNFLRSQRLPISCSISQVHSYAMLDDARRRHVRWKTVYRKICLMENPQLGPSSVLNRWEHEGNGLTKWELRRVIKELRKYRRYEHALEAYDWMNKRCERFPLDLSDAAILVDLIAKVHGISQAESYFYKLTDDLKDNRIYGALLNAYVQAKMMEKAESLLDQMRSQGYAMNVLPYNVMMTMYLNLKKYDKVDSIVSELIEKKIQLDIYSYNIWLSSAGYQGSVEKMEEVFERMKQDMFVIPDWTTFSTMATMYIKLDQFEKADKCLRMVETRIRGRDKVPYHYLLSLYGSMGKKEEVYRVWNIYKSIFQRVPNLGYHAIISSLIRMDDTEEAEELYEEWLSVKPSYDARIGNLLMDSYIKKGDIDKALDFLHHMIEIGGTPNSTTWGFAAQGHIAKRRISDALSCFKKAFKSNFAMSWKPKPLIVSGFFELCDCNGDKTSKEVLVDLLRQSGFLKNKSYASSIGLPVDSASNSIGTPFEGSSYIDIPVEGINGTRNDDETEMLPDQLESIF